MVTNEMAGKALAAFDMTFGGRCDDAHLQMWTNKMRAALEAVAPMIRAAALEEAARLCDDDADGRYRTLRMLPMIPVVATYAEAHARAAASRENAAAIRALNAPRDGS